MDCESRWTESNETTPLLPVADVESVESLSPEYSIAGHDGSRYRRCRWRLPTSIWPCRWQNVADWVPLGSTGVAMAIVSYGIGIAEGSLFEIKSGFCSARWFLSQKACCPDSSHACAQWRPWSDILRLAGTKAVCANFAIFALATVSLAALSHAVTSTTASPARATAAGKATRPFAAAGSGLAEVQVIVSGVALPGYLTLRTLATKTLALLLSISSGMCIGKEGPFVHIAACLGNLSCEVFPVHDAGRRRRIVGASIAGGVTVAFRAPISGTLFAFEVAGYVDCLLVGSRRAFYFTGLQQ